MSTPPDHGIARYRAPHKCRCEICRAAKREDMRQYRARRRAREGGEEVQMPEAVPSPVAVEIVIDWDAAPGRLEEALDEDIADEAGEVLWLKTLTGMARLNARLLDQADRHGRLDIVSPLQLRMLEILNRLAYMKVNNTLTAADKSDSSGQDTEAERQAAILRDLDGG